MITINTEVLNLLREEGNVTFDIKGKLLKKAVALADILRITVTEFLNRALSTGMKTLENAPKDGAETTQSESVTIIPTQNPVHEFIREHSATMTDKEIAAQFGYSLTTIGIYRRGMGIIKTKEQWGSREKSRKKKSFITANWDKMTDDEMAGQLQCAKITVSIIRQNFGLFRNKKGGASSVNTAQKVNHFAPSPLTPEQKEFVRANMAIMTNQPIAAQLQCTVAAVMQARNEICDSFIRANWEKMTDGDMGRALGCVGTKIAKRRNQLGLRRIQGGGARKKIQVALTKEILEKMLTEDGLTLADIGRNNGVSRERIRQIADNLGVSYERKPMWWANYWGKPELGNKEYVEQMLAEKGSASALARFLGLIDRSGHIKIKKICAMHGIAVPKFRKSDFQGTVELKCAHCLSPFTIDKSRMTQLQKKGYGNFFCGKTCFIEHSRTHMKEMRGQHSHAVNK